MTTALQNQVRHRWEQRWQRSLIPLLLAAVGLPASAPGQVAYVVNSDSSISASQIDDRTGAATPVPGSPYAAGLKPSSIAVDHAHRFVYITNAGSNDVSAFTADSIGALSPVLRSPFPAGVAPACVAVHPTGRFVYVTNFGSGDISVYRINAISGALNPVSGSPFVAGTNPSGLAVDSSGKFLYVANSGSASVSAFVIDSTTGALTPVAGSPFAAGRNAKSVLIDPTAKFAYVIGEDTKEGSVWSFAINPDSGELAAIPASPLATPGGALSAAIDPTGNFVYVRTEQNLATYSLDGNTGTLKLVRGSRLRSDLRSGMVMDSTGRFVHTTSTSKPLGIAVLPPVPSGTPLVSTSSPGTPRNNSTGGFGMKFTVGGTALNVTAVGRIFISGNTGSHLVKLVRASDGVDVPGGSATVSLPSGTAGDFVYVALASPVTLNANTAYYLVSEETNGGDQFNDLAGVIPTSAVTVNSGIVFSPGIGYIAVGPANDSYVPVNLLYTEAGIPPAVTITGPAAGATVSGNNVSVTATATPSSGTTVTSVQFQVDNVNQGAPVTTSPYGIVLDTTLLSNGAHSLTAVALDSANDSGISPSVSITVNNNPVVAVTTPAAGATVSGNSVPLTATASAATGLTITQVQFKVDNVNQGAPVTTSPYSIALDSTALTNASHSVVAVATDSLGHTSTSVPVTFTVNNTSTTVAINAPAAGATVSGMVALSATATAGAGLTISNVQFQLDNVNLGAPDTSSPYGITLDTTTLSNGVHSLTALATDSSNKTASSSPVSITISNAAPPPSGSVLISSFTSGSARNNSTGSFGLKFTVGAAALNVTALGRIYIAGNTGTHTVKLVRASDGVDVPGGAVTVSLPSGAAGQFAYAQLSSPVTLSVNTTYYLVSDETNGGDQFYDLGAVTPTVAVTVNSGVVFSPGVGYIAVGPANNSFVPVNLIYTSAGTPPAITITAPTAGATVSGNVLVVTAAATPNAGTTITSVQFQVDNVNQGAPVTTSPYSITLDTTALSNGTHSLTAVATDSASNPGTSAAVSITVNNNPTVSVTAPAAGTTVSGNSVPLMATAAAATGLTITQVQFKLDNANQGAPVTTSPYTTTLDSTVLSNASHSVVAVATDSLGHATTSAPINFTVNNTSTSVAITAPAAGATVSGTVAVSATATAGFGLTISNVQFQVDNVNLGAPDTSSPYGVTLDTTTLANGIHSLIAIATDSSNKAASSAPVSFNVSNAAPPASGNALITSISSGTPRNNSTGGFGLRFTVGATALNVTALGRIYIQGNTGSHVVKLVRSSDGLDVPGGSATVSLPSGTAGQFVYVQLANPVTLEANTSYYLISMETNGGDQFYDLGPVTSSSAVTVNSGVAYSPGLGFFSNVGLPNSSFVPVSLLYNSAGTPPSVAITTPAGGATVSGNTVAFSATATPAGGTTITSVQFQVDNVNQGAPDTTSPYGIVLDTTTLSNGTHSLTAIATDSANNAGTSPPVSVTVNNNPTVTITVPSAGATVSGNNVTLTATAAAVVGLTITQVQFKVDNANQGAPVTSNPYSVVLDSTTLTNASHSVVAVATDSLGHTTTSAPVNFTVNNTTTAVAITAPAAGATVSGTVAVAATATAGAGLTISSVQFQLDNVNQGAPDTSSPYGILLDTTTLTNGVHTLVAVATDSASKTASSAPVSFTVSNAAPPPSGNALISPVSSGTLRNNASGGFGMRFTVGATALNVSSLGRIYIQGNTGSHLVKLVRVSDGADVPGGSVTISLPSGTEGQFAYVPLANPVTLDANTSYYLISDETNGGDQFYDLGPVTASNVVTVNSGVAYSPALGFFSNIGPINNSFVPVSLLYTTAGTPPVVSITAPVGGSTISGNNVSVSATATPNAGTTITSVQFKVDNISQGSPDTTSPYGIVLDTTTLSNGSHSLTAVATDSSNNTGTSAPINITVNNNPTVAIAAPAPGATVSGNSVPLTATAVAAAGLTITQVQFKVDNANQGVPVTASPYTIALDSTTLTNASHSVVAVATDSLGHTSTSTVVNFTVNNTSTTVAVTGPGAGATVSGTIAVSATATAGAGLTIAKVQFQVDNVNQGAADTTSPYGIMLDTTTLSNGPHTLVAVATDSSNNNASSSPVRLTVSNAPPPPSGAALITAISTGLPRNNSTGSYGMKFTVGSTPLSVTALGRIYILGNTGSHIVKLVRGSDGVDVPGAAVTVSLPSGTAGQFTYVQLPSPVTLDANTVYYLVSDETNGGDQFYDLGAVTATNLVVVNNGIAFSPGIGYIPIGPANNSFVPVSLLYTNVGP